MFVTSLNQSEPNRPSFFEMMAQDQLVPALKPAIRYVASIVAVRNNGGRYEWVVKHIDELFAAGLFFLESRFLTNHDASFSENFYGLQRVRRVAVDASSAKLLGDPSVADYMVKPLRPSDRVLSLLFLVLVPYLKCKLDDLYKTSLKRRHRANGRAREEGTMGVAYKIIHNMEWLFVVSWPFASAIYEGLFFVYQLLYMHDYTNYYTPFLHLQRLELRRLSLQDLQLQARETLRRRRVELRELAAWGTRHKTGFALSAFVLLKSWSIKARHLLEDYGQLVLPLSIFLFKFLEWWYSNENLISPPKREPIPPPPDPPITSKRPSSPQSTEAYRLPTDKAECALCNRKRTNPACLSSSGLVFCYPCIHKYVSQHSRCPITLLPTSLDQIFHLYDS